MITSSSNIQLKQIAKLQKQAKTRKEQGAFLIEGKKLLEEAKRWGKLKKVYASEAFYLEEGNKQLLQDLETEIVEDKLFRTLTDTMTPQGVLAIAAMPSYSPEELLEEQAGCFLILENLRDPGNLGTIMRTAEGAGMTGVILSKESVDLFNPKVVRATMGAIFRQPFFYVEDCIGWVQHMKTKDYHIFGTAMEGELLYDEADYHGRTGIVIGNEASGLSPQMLAAIDRKVRIPMAGHLESLNAAVAAALFMYETARQRR